jgi:geranylgeranyl pyrophosphate synthase
MAFQTVAEDEQLDAATRVRVISEVARASGTPAGMVAGQAYDLDAESRDVTAADLEEIHRHKTGALIRAAARTGGIIAGAGPGELESISRYGSHLGLLFQITDDLLDVTASADALGKTPGKDERSSKATYPSLYGIEATQKLAETVHQDACQALDELEPPTKILRDIVEFILHRRG